MRAARYDGGGAVGGLREVARASAGLGGRAMDGDFMAVQSGLARHLAWLIATTALVGVAGTLSARAQSAPQYWMPMVGMPGGPGSWTNPATNWADAEGRPETWQGGTGIFAGALSGTVTVDDAIAFQSWSSTARGDEVKRLSARVY